MMQITKPQMEQVIAACLGNLGLLEGEREGYLDTTFDDLGFDSLARVELIEKLGDLSGTTLPDELLAEAATPGELLEPLNALLKELDTGTSDGQG
ncbi:acyl carrier protein [Streptomyces pathocidini]|uniref:acyl carrier protein n=1 Tax=Streptomyces pathocidini TaxID=1650571 RepID=UPI0033F00045